MRQRRDLHLVCAAANLRTGTLDGREHLIVPVTALVEGVIWPVNAETPEFVPASTVAAPPLGWDGRPVVLGHPEEDGTQVTANTPDRLTTLKWGTVFASASGTALTMEAWLDREKAPDVAGAAECLARLDAGETVEVSVGVFVTLEDAPDTFNDIAYRYVWRDIFPDHLALLPKGDVGACSVAMGCGALRHAIANGAITRVKEKPMEPEITGSAAANTTVQPKPKVKSLKERLTDWLGMRAALSADDMSDNDLRRRLLDALKDAEPYAGYVEAVYEGQGYFVYCTWDYGYGDSHWWTRAFTLATDGGVTIGSDRTEVEPVLIYEPLQADVTGAVRAALKAAAGRRHSQDDLELLQSAHDTLVTLGAVCVDPTMKGENGLATRAMEATEPRAAACGCGGQPAASGEVNALEGETMKTKEERIAALISNTKNKFAAEHQARLTSCSDNVLASIELLHETQPDVALTLLPAEEKTEPVTTPATETRAAAAAPAAVVTAPVTPAATVIVDAPASPKPLTTEEFMSQAPPEIRALVERQKAADVARRLDLVTTLKTAQAEYTEVELQSMPLDQLERVARVAKAAVPAVDYSGRGTPRTTGEAPQAPPPIDFNARIRTARGTEAKVN